MGLETGLGVGLCGGTNSVVEFMEVTEPLEVDLSQAALPLSPFTLLMIQCMHEYMYR